MADLDRDNRAVLAADHNTLVPCFTPGTCIATPKGERPVETLVPGDRVITRDNGIQSIAWVGQKPMTMASLAIYPKLRPVMIKAGALGDHLPVRDMMVSPNHRMLIVSDRARAHFDSAEVLVPAKHMTKAGGIQEADVPTTTYVHFMCEHHQVVMANGTWTESFQPSDYTLEAVGVQQREEIFDLFPELVSVDGLRNYKPARKTTSLRESLVLWAKG